MGYKKGVFVMSIGDNIKRIREAKGISQYALAKMLKISQQSVDQWERSVTNPRKNNIDKLAKILNVSANELFANDIENNPPIINSSKEYSLNNNANMIVTDHERELLNKYRQLSEVGKIKVEARLDAEYDIMKEAEYTESQDA